MQTLGQFIVGRRKELGLAGREVVAKVRNSDGARSWTPWANRRLAASRSAASRSMSIVTASVGTGMRSNPKCWRRKPVIVSSHISALTKQSGKLAERPKGTRLLKWSVLA
jgi:hypothetical protein